MRGRARRRKLGHRERKARLPYGPVSPTDYGTSLEEDIQANTSGYLERILVCLLQELQPRLLESPCLGDSKASPQRAALE